MFFSFTFPASGRAIEPRIILRSFSPSPRTSFGTGRTGGWSVCPTMGRMKAVVPSQA